MKHKRKPPPRQAWQNPPMFTKRYIYKESIFSRSRSSLSLRHDCHNLDVFLLAIIISDLPSGKNQVINFHKFQTVDPFFKLLTWNLKLTIYCTLAKKRNCNQDSNKRCWSIIQDFMRWLVPHWNNGVFDQATWNLDEHVDLETNQGSNNTLRSTNVP